MFWYGRGRGSNFFPLHKDPVTLKSFIEWFILSSWIQNTSVIWTLFYQPGFLFLYQYHATYLTAVAL